MGVIARGQAVDSPFINLDVEPGGPCAKIVVQPNHIELEAVDLPYRLQVSCTFADGTFMDITHSTQIQYTSFNTSVATVDQNGLVRLVGPGMTTIMASFNGQTKGTLIEVPKPKPAVPSTSASASPAPNASGWDNSNVAITLTALETGQNPSGVKQITYSASGAQSIASTTVTSSTATFPVTAEGITTVSYFAVDNAGNTETTKNLTVKIDETPPAIQCGSPEGQWHAADVNVVCTASDALSGLATASNASFSLSTNVPAGAETANATTSSASICDLAGSCANAGPVAGFMVDKKPPVINITVPSAGTPSYTLKQAITASYSCTDGGSGVAACAGPVANGSNLDTTSTGSKSFAVNATDKAGNASSTSANYVVSYGICLLYDQTKSVNSGATIPIKFTLCDASGADASSSVTAVTALNIQLISTSASTTVVTYATGSSDSNFHFDATLGASGGYIYNLSTKGFSTGTYQMTISVGGDPIQHALQFQVRS